MASTKDAVMEDKVPNKPLEELGGQLLSQGAEAKVYKFTFLQQPTIVKERFPKTYRLPVLDQKLSYRRLLQEAKCIAKCRKCGVDTPTVYFVDTTTNRLYLEFIDGITVKQFLYNNHSATVKNEKECVEACAGVGRSIALTHDADIIHGDLTTSNVMLRGGAPNSVVMIDFGLSYNSGLAEDKAVDLYVLERAFLSTHPSSEALFNSVLESYKSTSKKAQQTFAKLEQVRLRGRKKLAFG